MLKRTFNIPSGQVLFPLQNIKSVIFKEERIEKFYSHSSLVRKSSLLIPRSY